MVRGTTFPALMVLAACSSTPQSTQSTQGSAEATTDETTDTTTSPPPGRAVPWRTVAGEGSGVAAAEAALARVDDAGRGEVEAVLDRMAGFGTGPDALRAAGALAEDRVGVADDPDWTANGMPPGTAALHAGGLAVLEGIAVLSARATPNAYQGLVDAICSMKMPVHFNSGGRASDVELRGRLVRATIVATGLRVEPPAMSAGCVEDPR